MALPPLSLLRRCAGALGGTSLAAAVAFGGGALPATAQAGGGVNVTSYGHSALLIQGVAPRC